MSAAVALPVRRHGAAKIKKQHKKKDVKTKAAAPTTTTTPSDDNVKKVNLRDPKVWGSKYWDCYDIVVNTYPKRPSEKHKKAARMYFSSQKLLIPCHTCAANYSAIIKQYPPRVESRAALQQWLQIVKVEVSKHKAAAATTK